MIKWEEMVIENMARVGYEVMWDEAWADLSPNSIERTLWRKIASNMLNEFRRISELGKEWLEATK